MGTDKSIARRRTRQQTARREAQILIVIFLLLLTASASADMLLLRGYGQLHDDSIDEQYPHRNYGVNNVLEFGVKYTGGELYQRKTFVKPEMSLWSGGSIDSVRLVIFASAGQGHVSSYFYISRLLIEPTYGDSGSANCPTDSAGMVFNARHCECDSTTGVACDVDSLAWSQIGCNGVGTDFMSEPSDSFQLSSTAGDSTVIYLTDDFRWFSNHPDSTFGWVLWRNESTAFGTYRGIISSNATFAGGIYRPRLEIFYSQQSQRRSSEVIGGGIIGEGR